MQSKAKIVLQIQTDPQKAKKQAKTIGKDVANQVNKGASQITFGEKIKKQFDSIKDGVGGVGESLGKLGGLGKVFVGGWISAAVAGVTLLAKVGMDVYDKLTLTADEMIKKGEALSKIANDKMKQIFSDQSDADAYIQRLIELNKVQSLSMAQRLQSIAIINQLTKVYGNLGLSVSDATGRILGLDQALEKVRKLNQSNAVETGQKNLEAKEMSASGAMEKVLENMMGRFWELWKHDGILAFREFQKDMSRSEIFKKGINVKFNENFIEQSNGTRRKLTAEETKLAKMWNNGGLEGKAKFLQQKIKTATTEDEIEVYQKLLDSINEVIKAQKELKNLKQTGFKTNKEYLNYLKEENANIQKLRQSVKKLIKQSNKQRQSKQEQEFYAGLSTPQVKIQYQQVKETKVGKEYDVLAKKVGKLNQELFLAQQSLQKALNGNNTEEIAKAYKRVNDLTKQMTKSQEELIKKQNERKNIQDEIARQKKAQRDNDLKELKTAQEKIKFLEKQIQMQKKLQQKSNKGAEDAKASVQKITEEKRQNDIKLGRAQHDYAFTVGNEFATYLKPNVKLQGLDSFEKIIEIKPKIEKIQKNKDEALKKGDIQGYNNAEKQLKQYQDQLAQLQAQAKRVSEWFHQQFLKGENVEVPEFWDTSKQQYIKHLKQIEKIRQAIGIYQKQEVELNKAISEQKEKQSSQEKQALQAKTLQLQRQNQIKEIEKRASNYYQDTIKDLYNEQAIQSKLLQGLYEEAERLKIINELRKQGIKIDEKEVDKRIKQQQVLKSINVDKTLKSQGNSLLDKYGANDKKYQYQKRIRELEQANQIKLDDEQKKKVKMLVDLEFKLGDMEKLKPDFSAMEIKTNDLTRRGGGVGAAVAPDIETVSKQIRDYNAKSVSLLNQIKNTLQKGGII